MFLIKKKSDLCLIDKKTYLDFLKQQMNYARRDAYKNKNSDLEQLQKRGEYMAYRNVIKFFENLLSEV